MFSIEWSLGVELWSGVESDFVVAYLPLIFFIKTHIGHTIMVEHRMNNLDV